jgi:hypothetical protein
MRKILLLPILIFVTNIYAQDTITNKVVISDEYSRVENNTSKKNVKNSIKFNPLLLFNGDIPLFYERMIISSLSAEIALGMTSRDYLGNFGRLFDDEIVRENSKENTHFSYKLALKYYTGDVALEGFYISLEYANRKHSQKVVINSSSYNQITGNYEPSSGNFVEQQRHKEFKVICGAQENDYSGKIFFDYYIGVGIDKRNISSIEPNRDNATGLEIYSLEKIEEFKPRFYLGVKLGFQF